MNAFYPHRWCFSVCQQPNHESGWLHANSEVCANLSFFCRSELEFLYQFGTSEIFPDEWERYIAPIPVVERKDLMGAYHRRLTGRDEKVRSLASLVPWLSEKGRV